MSSPFPEVINTSPKTYTSVPQFSENRGVGVPIPALSTDSQEEEDIKMHLNRSTKTTGVGTAHFSTAVSYSRGST